MFKIGIVFLVMAGFGWASPLYVPFTPLDGSSKVIAITIGIVLAEILFWVGAFCVGKEFINTYKGRFSPRHWKKTK